jgi:hypothetical protein
MKPLSVITALLLLVVAGVSCTSKPVFVMLRDVPQDPTFVVLPGDRASLYFANEIEAALIRSKVSVRSRPPIKQIVAERTAAKASSLEPQGRAASVEGAEGTLTERYDAIYEDFDADYVVWVYRGSRQIRIEKKETSEILSVFELPSDRTLINHYMNASLRAIGIDNVNVPHPWSKKESADWSESSDSR